MARYKSLIGKNFSNDNILYHGDVVARENYVDGEDAHNIFEKIEKVNKNKNEIQFSIFGEERTIRLPEADETILEFGKHLNVERYSAVVDMTVEKIINDDRVIVFWKRFFQSYDLYGRAWILYIKNKQVKEQSIKIDSIVWNDDDKIPTGFKKEFLEWFYRTDPLVIQWVQQHIAQTKSYSDGKVHWVYMDLLRSTAFKDFSEYSSRLTRPMSNLQYDLLFSLWQESWIAGARKTGKTAGIVSYASGYWYSYRRTKRQLRIARLSLSEESLKSWRMYLRSQLSELFDLWAIDETKTENTFNIQDVYQEEGKWKKDKMIKKTIAQVEMKYVSKWSMEKKVALGGVYDLIVVDEAELITPKFYKWLMSLVKQDWSQIIFLMNFNEEWKKTFWYNKFIEAEKKEFEREAKWETVEHIVNEIWDKYKLGSYDSLEELLASVDINKAKAELRSRREMVWKRYSIWDNDMLTDEEKVKTVNFFREEDYVTYLTHYECVMPNEKSIFDLSDIRVQLDVNERFQLIFPVFDPSKNHDDPSWLDFYGYKSDPSSPHYNRLILLESLDIKWTSIKMQMPEVKVQFDRIMNKYLDPMMNIHTSYIFLYDPNGIGQSVRDYLYAVKITRVVWIHVVGDGDREVEDEKVFRINKADFIESLSSGIAEWIIKIQPHHGEAYRQLTVLEELSTPTGKTTYGAPQGDHDERVSNMWMVNRFALKNGIKHRYLMDKVKELQKLTDKLGKEISPIERERNMQKKEILQKQAEAAAAKRKNFEKKYLY
jgi:hypothetical protein